MRRNQLYDYLRYDMKSGLFCGRKSGKVLGEIDADGYVQIWFDGNKYKACNLAWFLIHDCWPRRPIIHINGVNHNDWMDNLKISTNIKRQSNNTSGIPGVSLNKKNKKWCANIQMNNKRQDLGSYEKFDTAVLARSNAEVPDSNSLARQYVKSKGDLIDKSELLPIVRKLKSNTSGVTGVSRNKINKNWRVFITIKNKRYSLGSYKGFDQAVLARSNAEVPNPNSPAQQYINKMFL